MSDTLVAVVDREECMGFGYCTETLPDVFSIAEDGLADVDRAASVNADPELLEEAVDGCPRGAVSLSRVEA